MIRWAGNGEWDIGYFCRHDQYGGRGINGDVARHQADIVKLAMVEIDEFLKKEGYQGPAVGGTGSAHLLLQVHDELVYEIKENLVDSVAPEIKKIMENIIPPKETSGVICVANSSAGDNWGEMKEIK